MRSGAIRQGAALALLALTCIHVAGPLPAVGADLRPAEPHSPEPHSAASHRPGSQADERRASKDGAPALTGGGFRITGLTPHTPVWFLEMMRRLLNEGRADEAYSLAREGLALFPHSAELNLGAAYAAQAAGRCAQADTHLLQLDEDELVAGLRQRAAYLRAACHGPWRRHLRLDAIIGYRPSLLDRARDPVIRLQPGSALHQLCWRLRFICDPDRAFRSQPVRDSGIDFWHGLTFVNRYRAGTAWDFDLETMLFRRRPFRSGFDGDAGMLRATATHHNNTARQISLVAETGLSRFQLGRADLLLAQRHFRARFGLTAAHSATRRSHFGLAHLAARSQWRKLVRQRASYHQEFLVGYGMTPWLGGAAERTRQSGAVTAPDARAREGSVGLNWKGRLGALYLRQTLRTEKFGHPLAFLSVPHRTTTRLTGLDLVPKTGRRKTNLKVVLSFEYRKISSPDPYQLRSSRTLILRLSYDAFKR